MTILPRPTWECDYRRERRKHAHRCRCCGVVLKHGERVIMAKRQHGSIAIHAACGDKVHTPEGGWTWRDAMEAWGTEHVRKLGWARRIPEHPMSRPGAVKGAA